MEHVTFLVQDIRDAGPRPCATQRIGTRAAEYSQWCHCVVPCGYLVVVNCTRHDEGVANGLMRSRTSAISVASLGLGGIRTLGAIGGCSPVTSSRQTASSGGYNPRIKIDSPSRVSGGKRPRSTRSPLRRKCRCLRYRCLTQVAIKRV